MCWGVEGALQKRERGREERLNHKHITRKKIKKSIKKKKNRERERKETESVNHKHMYTHM